MTMSSEFRISTSLEDSHWWYRGIYALVREFLPLNQRQELRLLDAGCGSGGLLRALRGHAAMIGVDIAQDALAAGRTAATDGLARACAERLPMPEGAFDAVASVDVLCHETCDAAEALREIRRVLKPGGRLLLHMPAYEWLKGPHDLAGRNRRRYTAREVARLLASAGFVVQKITYRNTLLFPVACVRRLAQKMILGDRESSDVNPLPIWLNGFLCAVLRLETRLLKMLNLPFGLSIFAVAVKPSPNLYQE